jgi:hypothetical protein
MLAQGSSSKLLDEFGHLSFNSKIVIIPNPHAICLHLINEDVMDGYAQSHSLNNQLGASIWENALLN